MASFRKTASGGDGTAREGGRVVVVSVAFGLGVGIGGRRGAGWICGLFWGRGVG